MEAVQAIQFVVGAALFLATGWFLARAFFKGREADAIERATLGLALAAVIPALVLVFLNLALGIPFNVFVVYGTFVLLIAVAAFYSRK